MKKLLIQSLAATFAIASFITLATAMEMGNPDEIPVPDTSFHAMLYDIDDMPFDATDVAFNKYTYISGKRGATEVFIPFDRIQKLEIMERGDDVVISNILLRDGTQCTVETSSHLEFTGKASFGHFRLKIQHLKYLEFSGTVQPSTGL